MAIEKISNNTLFEKKHRYMFALREIEILKRQIEVEALNSEISLSRLEEIKVVWNYIFVGLLREKLSYQVINNVNDANKDMLRITIDGVHYECLVDTVKNILKEDFDNVLSDVADELNERHSYKLDFEKINDADDITEDDAVNENNPEDSVEENSSIDFYETVRNEQEEIMITAEEENMKSEQTMVYDHYYAEILAPGASSGDKLEIMVFPKTIEKESTKAEILVVIKDMYDTRFYYSKDIASVVVNFKENEFIIRGMFSNYNFSSAIIPHGTTAALNCALNLDKVEYRCQKLENANYGHIYYKVKNDNDEPIGIHIVPLNQSENNKYGIANVALFVEEDGKIVRGMINEDAKGMAAVINDKTIELVNYWQDGYLISETLFDIS